MTDTTSPDVATHARSVSVRTDAETTRAAITRAVVRTAVAVRHALRRHRHKLKFLAALHDVGRPAQLHHAWGLLARAWGFQLALKDG